MGLLTLKRKHAASVDPGTAEATPPASPCLSWIEEDIENRLGFFQAGRYTSVNQFLSFLLGLLLTAGFFAALVFGLKRLGWGQMVVLPFIRPGNVWTVGPTMLFCFWSMVFLFLKSRKIGFQQKALELAAVPQQSDFVLNETTARTVLQRLHTIVDHPRHFLLLNRIDRALSNLHHLGGLSDVSTILRGQAENDENHIASSYTLVNGLVWAIPVLGFIGTVQGLSVAIGNFTKTLQGTADLAAIKANLQGVTGGLATAFETTLVALVCALIIQLYATFLQQRESEFMDQCGDYCHTHVVSKLRLARLESPGAPPDENAVPSGGQPPGARTS